MLASATPWDVWLRTWETHAKTEAFRKRLRAAVDIALQGHGYGRLFCAMSGGKDSVALAGVVAAAGLRAKVPLVHCHTDLNTPGMEQCAQLVAEKLDMDLEIVEPDLSPYADVWDLLRSLPTDIDVTDERNHLPLRNATASGNMLVAYQYENRYDGAFSGMRGEESAGRSMNRRTRGPLYQLKKDESWMCLPIVDWSARDVFAWTVQCGLPICDHYRLLNDRFGVSPESPGSRVDCVITTESIARRGSMVHLKALYPDLWRRIRSARPELERLATA